jgi:hypothetical protein
MSALPPRAEIQRRIHADIWLPVYESTPKFNLERVPFDTVGNRCW